MKTVLISGAGIAGTTLAYWLLQYGFKPVIVEKAPAFRKGGYIIDFWGIGYEMAEKMNLLTEMQKKSYHMHGVNFVNSENKRISGFSTDIFEKQLKGRFFSILRSDLARTIYESIENKVEILFGNSIKEIINTSDCVEVVFDDGNSRKFDLLVGADGLHSVVRNIVFANQTSEKFLGYYVAAFSTENYPHRNEGVYVCYNTPGRQVARLALRDSRTVFFLIFADSEDLEIPSQKDEQKRNIVKKAFSGAGWELNDILTAMDKAQDFYFDSVTQIKMNNWSQGRIALVGDAAYCPSLLAGHGAALAMAGAYVLAGELSRVNNNYSEAFTKYEQLFMPFLARKQKAAEQFSSSFAPKTSFGLFIRNLVTNLFWIPGVSNKFVNDMVADEFILPNY